MFIFGLHVNQPQAKDQWISAWVHIKKESVLKDCHLVVSSQKFVCLNDLLLFFGWCVKLIKMEKRKLIANFALLFAAMMWGGSYAVQSIMSRSISTFTTIFLKSCGGILLILMCFINKKKLTKKTIYAGVLTGLVNCDGLILQQIGIANTTVSKSSFISGLYVVFVPILGLFTRKKPKPRFWFAIIIAFFGMYMLCMQGNESLGFGDLITLSSIIFFALQIIFIDKYGSELDAFSYCAVQQVTTATVSGILAFAIERPQLSNFSGMLLPILYVVFCSGMVGQLLQNKYQKDVEPTLASLIMSLESVFGALGGWLLLNQTLTGRELIGCALMFIAILIAE